MAKIIEICGTPGVGKSTIFKEIESRNHKNNTWSSVNNKNPFGEETRQEFFYSIFTELRKGRQPINSRVKKLESRMNFIKRIYRKYKLGRNFVDLYDLKSAGDKFIAQYPSYVDACWKNIFYRQAKSNNGLDLRFEKAEFIYLIIKKFQVLKEKNSKKTMIIDEGLVNMIDRGLYKSDNTEDEKLEIQELLETMPWPDALVFIETSLEEIANRIMTRKDIRDMHKGLSISELIDFTENSRQRIAVAIEYLKAKGIPVLYLDSKNSISKNAGEIITFAESISISNPVQHSNNIVA